MNRQQRKVTRSFVLFVLLVLCIPFFEAVLKVAELVPPVCASPGVAVFYPSSYNLSGSTTLVSGSLTDLQSDNAFYMTFRSYVSLNGSQSTFGYSTAGASTTNTEDTLVGSVFTTTQNGWADSITAYIGMTVSAKNMKCMIYKHSDSSLVGTTAQVNVAVGTAWITFNFNQPKPWLTANTDYVLVAWSAWGTGNAYLYYSAGSANQGHTQGLTYGTPPNPATFTHNNNQYSIYCTYTPPSEYTSEVEFTGTSNLESWTRLKWTIDSSFTTTGVTTTLQLYNYDSGGYPTSGDGYMTGTIGTTDVTKSQTITTNPTHYRNSTGGWKIKIKGVKSTATQFDWKGDLVRFEGGLYALNLRVRDWDLTDNIQGADVYVDSYVETSDVNGWANLTCDSGTVQIQVKYYGFWVNGTFSVTMDSDKTITVKCKLYDVTITVQESVQGALLYNANVTVFNASKTSANKIKSGITGKNGQVALTNLPNNTLVFTQYGGSSYTSVIGNTTQLISSENQSFTVTSNQNYVSTTNTYRIIAWVGALIPLKKRFKTKRLKRKVKTLEQTLQILKESPCSLSIEWSDPATTELNVDGGEKNESAK